MTGWLLVVAAERTIALPVGVVEEVAEIPPPLPAPGREAAVRGVVPVRGRLVPLVHLGALLGVGTMTGSASPAGVIVTPGGRRLVLEVDAVVDLVDVPEEALPRTWGGGWAASALRSGGGVVPVLDVDWLIERLLRGAEGTMATA